MKKILLASLTAPFLEDDMIYPPLALLYLQAAINQHTDLQAEIVNQFTSDKINQCDGFDFLGVSVFTPQRHSANEILAAAKETFPSIKTIIGGCHATYYTDECMKANWDYIVVGDGDLILPQIMKEIPQERVLAGTVNEAQLNQLPRPDRLGNYKLLNEYHYQLDDINGTTAITGRGCPMRCRFCEHARSAVRRTSVEKFEQELDDIVSLGYSALYIFDDLFAINPQKSSPYLHVLMNSGLSYRCNGHARFMTPSFAQQLADSGCAEIAFGAESGSQQILDTVMKQTTIQQNYDFVQMCKKAGLLVRGFLMLGLPGESYETIAETEKFIVESGIDKFQLSIYCPFKGTELRTLLDTGQINNLFFDREGLMAYGQRNHKSECLVWTPDLSKEDIIAERDRLIRTYNKQ